MSNHPCPSAKQTNGLRSVFLYLEFGKAILIVIYSGIVSDTIEIIFPASSDNKVPQVSKSKK